MTDHLHVGLSRPLLGPPDRRALIPQRGGYYTPPPFGPSWSLFVRQFIIVKAVPGSVDVGSFLTRPANTLRNRSIESVATHRASSGPKRTGSYQDIEKAVRL